MKTYRLDWSHPDTVFADRRHPETGLWIKGWGGTMTGGSLRIKARSESEALDFFCQSNDIRFRDLVYELTLVG